MHDLRSKGCAFFPDRLAHSHKVAIPVTAQFTSGRRDNDSAGPQRAVELSQQFTPRCGGVVTNR